MVVTGIFHFDEAELASQLVRQNSDQIYEEKIGENETLVAVRATSLHQAKLISDLLSQAGAENVVIESQTA